ncbi:MAG TPA: hypothetical protein VNH20_02670 [Candidatus Dormibacteraeota bacterium]|nr:hypothetical protein [Candidatus Dormibacteraeota bacterium]
MSTIHRLKLLRLLIVELPQQLRLAYCLARDPRTPAPLKAALAGSLALILNPAIDLPAWIPVVGQMDAIALTVLAVRAFNSQAPRGLREEIEADIRARRSRFDEDLRRGTLAAGRLALLARTGPALARRQARPLAAARPPVEPAPWYRSQESAGGSPAAAGGEAGSDLPLPPASKEQSI